PGEGVVAWRSVQTQDRDLDFEVPVVRPPDPFDRLGLLRQRFARSHPTKDRRGTRWSPPPACRLPNGRLSIRSKLGLDPAEAAGPSVKIWGSPIAIVDLPGWKGADLVINLRECWCGCKCSTRILLRELLFFRFFLRYSSGSG